MAKFSKRVRAFREKVDATRSYPLDEAIALLKEFGTVKFNETVEVAVNLGVDARKSDQGVRGATTLPHGTGSEVRVAVFTQGENAEKAKAAGADFVGMEELAEQIKGGMMDFEVVVASPDAMRIVGQLGQVLDARLVIVEPLDAGRGRGRGRRRHRSAGNPAPPARGARQREHGGGRNQEAETGRAAVHWIRLPRSSNRPERGRWTSPR